MKLMEELEKKQFILVAMLAPVALLSGSACAGNANQEFVKETYIVTAGQDVINYGTARAEIQHMLAGTGIKLRELTVEATRQPGKSDDGFSAQEVTNVTVTATVDLGVGSVTVSVTATSMAEAVAEIGKAIEELKAMLQ
jgi:hypothetical protein